VFQSNFTIKGTKKELRISMKTRLSQPRSYPPQISALLDRLKPFLDQSTTVGVYAPNSLELDPTPIIQRCFELNKQVFLPVIINKESKLMNFHQIYSMKEFHEDLKENSWNIKEPDPEKSIQATSLDLVLVPGLGFDSRGYRLGRGGGYFDRYFKRVPCKVKIGICYDFQIIEEITDVNEFDIKMDQILTI
jgi:5-formyltetrahydrofolate cyclo-ligase